MIGCVLLNIDMVYFNVKVGSLLVFFGMVIVIVMVEVKFFIFEKFKF